MIELNFLINLLKKKCTIIFSTLNQLFLYIFESNKYQYFLTKIKLIKFLAINKYFF